MAPRANWKGFLRLSLRPVGRAGDVGQREGLLQPEQQEHRPPHITLRSMPRPARKRPVRTSSRATRLTPTLTSQSTRRARQHRAREHTHYRHGRIRPEVGDRRALIRVRAAVLHRARGRVGHDAVAVIRETIRSMDKVAIARVVLTSRGISSRGRRAAGLCSRPDENVELIAARRVFRNG